MTYTGAEFTAIGLVNGNTVTSVTLTSTGDPVTATVGGYPIVPAAAVGTGLNNYTISYANGALTVTPKTLVITASDRTKTYGDAVTFAGTEFTTPAGVLVNGDIVTGVTLASTGALATATVAGSPYPIVASAAVGNGLGNYTISYVNGILTVNRKALTITANNQSKTYGQVFTFAGTEFTSAGLINGNTITSVTLTSAGTAANATVAGSPYSIIPSLPVGTGLGNYTINYVNGVFTVTTKAVTITAANRTKTYGTAVVFTGTEFTIPAGALINGDVINTVTLTSTGAAAGATVAGSPYPIVASAAIGSGLGNYTITYVNGLLTVSQRVLTVGGSFTANNKVYDGTTSATFATNNLTLLTIVGGDNVVLNATPVFADKVVGTGKPVSLTGLSISGTDASNYTLSLTGLPTATADITARVLTIGGTFTAINKVYDGTVAATISNNNLTLLTTVGTDVVNLNAVAVFSDKAIGTGKIVSLTGSSLTGADAANYSLSFAGAPTTTADITAKALTIGGSFTANNKVYDATTDAAIATNNLTLLTKAASDDVTLTAVAVFANKTVGTGKIVSLTGSSLAGADAANYTLSLTGAPTAIADITTNELTIGGTFTVNNKAYDGTTAATILSNGLTLLTVAGSDNVTLTAVATFSDALVGSGKTVSLAGSSISGSDASNYTLSLIGAPTTTAAITESGLTITGVTANSKVYDGTTTAVLNTTGAILVGTIGTDVVTLVSTGATGTFEDKNVGMGKNVIINGFVITGADAYKYTLIQPTATADITPIGLTITGATADNKIYDGTTTALLNTESAILVGVLDGDIVNLVSAGATGSFADKNVGTAKVVSTSLFTLEGTDAGNYTLTQPTLAADITPAELTVSGVTANNKIYDGTTTAILNTGSATLMGVFGADDVNLISTGATATFNDKNAGIGKPVSTSGFTIAGTDISNYSLSQPALIADIQPKELTITANDLTKTYGEELTFAGTEFSITGLVQGDPIPPVTLTSSGAPASANAGTYGIIVSGGSDSNYNITYVEGVLTVNKADQIISFTEIPSGLRMTETYQLVATASSGLAVSFEVSDPNIVTLYGTTLTINQDGNFTVTASQQGDQNWNPAPDVIQSVLALPTFDHISSLFTPNSDGMNDYWYIPDLVKYGKLQVTVYNRYGQAVYRSESYKNDWDGTWNGNPLPSATYYYIIKSSTKGIIKGVVNIVR
jgi:gliding motility-associated-like protein